MDMDSKLRVMLVFLSFVGMALLVYIGDIWRRDDWFANSELTGKLVTMLSFVCYMALIAFIMNIYLIRLSAEVEE